jgi:hypothetical protein
MRLTLVILYRQVQLTSTRQSSVSIVTSIIETIGIYGDKIEGHKREIEVEVLLC